jgi:hypothetical protein
VTDQLGFADAFVDPRLGANDKLARIGARIDGSALASQLGDLRAAPTGRRPYPALKMRKPIRPTWPTSRRPTMAMPQARALAMPIATACSPITWP